MLEGYLKMRKNQLSQDLSGKPDTVEDQEPLNLGGTRQLVMDLVQLIEAKALAHRLAFKAMVQELSAVAGPDVAVRIQRRLDALQLDPAMVGRENGDLQQLIAQELSSLIDVLDEVVAHPERRSQRPSSKGS